MRTLQIISINHKSHSTKERLDLNLDNYNWEVLFSYMKFELKVEGYVHLSTCNRIELYYEGSKDLRFQIVDKWISLLGDDLSVDRFRFKTYYGSMISLRYLLDLSVGKQSAIKGDDQIFAQLKKAFLLSSQNGYMSTLLERGFQTIMRSHKQICKETNYCRQVVSLAYHSLKSIYKTIPKAELSSKRVLIIGAGDMAAQVVKYIDKFNFQSVSISNRTIEKAKTLCIGKEVEVIPYETLNPTHFDVVVSCTDMGYERINDIELLDYYVDLSVRSANLKPINTPHILLQELQAEIKRENQIRFSSLGRVNRFLSDHATEFNKWEYDWQQRQLEQVATEM